MNGTRQPLEKRRIAVLLLLVVLSGTLFRVAGLSSGYPRVDDVVVARQIAQNYQGDWRPDFVYYYPNFFDYIVAVGLRGLSALFRLVGVQRGPGLFPFSLDQILFAARLLSALLGSATILVVYAIGRRLYSAREGLIASGLYSAAFIPILFSHQIALDVPMTFFSPCRSIFASSSPRRGAGAITHWRVSWAAWPSPAWLASFPATPTPCSSSKPSSGPPGSSCRASMRRSGSSSRSSRRDGSNTSPTTSRFSRSRTS